jgi:hypothetical protein
MVYVADGVVYLCKASVLIILESYMAAHVVCSSSLVVASH